MKVLVIKYGSSAIVTAMPYGAAEYILEALSL
eukprot:CAMPEP_0204847660 /NCGR_PEP_ID=MMETSP1347-20130617/2934_1 /ASSEMBLY_ACC=CAM_ASM_000690 /TAXON_ID=215587 /ORGANISM="Aplanochytrium stocchinoi, Strain GSBS06" /LENGTH=31 /DNA_ID= /DNA_START= /DNA_END= /DNA_ORIENTATION=